MCCLNLLAGIEQWESIYLLSSPTFLSPLIWGMTVAVMGSLPTPFSGLSAPVFLGGSLGNRWISKVLVGRLMVVAFA